jgi:hypothetical protein
MRVNNGSWMNSYILELNNSSTILLSITTFAFSEFLNTILDNAITAGSRI